MASDRVQTHTCWDGGLREVLPLHAAVDAGAQRVIAISASNRRVVGEDRFSRHLSQDPISTILRTTDILVDEVHEGDRALHQDVDVLHIHPELAIQGVQEISPGINRANMAYGYMTAHDALAKRPSNVALPSDIDRRSASDKALLSIRLAMWEVVNAGWREELAAVALELWTMEKEPSRDVPTPPGVPDWS